MIPRQPDAVVLRVVGVLVVILGACLTAWARIYKTRKVVSADNGERRRFDDAINDAIAARKEAHDANNVVMSVQNRLGKLEAENGYLIKRVEDLERENERQRDQISGLLQEAATRRRLTDTDFK